MNEPTISVITDPKTNDRIVTMRIPVGWVELARSPSSELAKFLIRFWLEATKDMH